MMFIFFILAVAYAQPASVACVEGFTCTLDRSTGEFTITGSGAMPDFSSQNDQPWSADRTNIEIVKIGEGISSIGNYAFDGAENLREVSLSATVATIGEWAFGNCIGLGTIKFANSDISMTIKQHAFQGMNNKNEAIDLVLPDNVKIIESNAFGSAKIKTVTMEGVETIGAAAFSYIGSLTSIVIESCPTSIDFTAFNDISGLIEIEITDSECTKYYTSDGILLFKNETDIEIMTYPPQKTESVFPDGVTILCEECYAQKSLKTVTLPSTIRIIRKGAFKGNSFTTIEFNEGLEIIEKDAFASCSQLKTVQISSTLETMGDNVFSYCDNLEKFELSKNYNTSNENAFFHAENGILYANSKKILVKSPPKNVFTDGKYINNDDLEVIYSGAFQSNINLKTLELKGNLHTIHKEAFAKCTALKTVTISTTQLESIGENLFSNDVQLESVTLGDGVEMIGAYMFSGCTKLSTVSLGKKIFTIEANSFMGTAITSIVIPDTCQFIKHNAFQNCIELKTVTIGNSVVEITENAFYGCKKLESVTFNGESKLVRIDTGVFVGTKLSSVEIPPSVLIIDDNAFGDCESLTTITYEGPQQPAYCSPSAFEGSPVGTINLVENYPQQEFCGLRVETAEQPPSGSNGGNNEDPSNDDDDEGDGSSGKKPTPPNDGNKDNGSTLMTIVLSVILAFLIF